MRVKLCFQKRQFKILCAPPGETHIYSLRYPWTGRNIVIVIVSSNWFFLFRNELQYVWVRIKQKERQYEHTTHIESLFKLVSFFLFLLCLTQIYNQTFLFLLLIYLSQWSGDEHGCLKRVAFFNTNVKFKEFFF